MSDNEAPAQLDVLVRGEIELAGRLPWASNATYLVELCHQGTSHAGVYKPKRGERPLWDFPQGLGRREVAAYQLSEALAWELVPPTVWRDGPMGEGSVQWFVSADFDQHYFTLQEDPVHHERLKAICVFDIIANNSDRKSGHCLIDEDGAIHAIDNGLSFHEEPKLRTVIWDFAGETIPTPLVDDVRRFVAGGVPMTLVALLDDDEQEALMSRAETLAHQGRFPTDRSGRRHPWPLV